ncbi:MAG: DUF3825 domain-containing protein [Atopobiaceae bacterium]
MEKAQDREEVSLFEFAYLGEMTETLKNLADMALPERWDFTETDAPEYEILRDYLSFTFLRLEREDKVLVDDEGDFCAFDTGLVDESYEAIYACFTPNRVPDRMPWYLSGFATAGSGRLGDRLLRSFHDLPERARYLFTADDVLYDVDQVPTPDYEHILIDNVDRLPEAFLLREFADSDEELASAKRAFAEQDKERRDAAFDDLAKLLEADQLRFRRLKDRLDAAIRLSVKKVSWNWRWAVPIYYPARDCVSLLLPLDLTEDEQPDIALVLERTQSGRYIGQTILTAEMAYKDARLIARPGAEWLDVCFG